MPGVFQPVPDTVEVTVEGSYEGQLVENKFYAQAGEAITVVLVDALAQIVADWVASTMLALVPADYKHTRVVARDLSSEASYEVINVDNAGDAGTLAGQALPGNASLAVHRSTGLSGKKAKSRIYWPALSVGILTDPDTITAAFGTALTDALETLRQNIETDASATWVYGYPQRVIGGVKLATANFITVIGHSLTDLFVDSQRRRLKGRGA